MTVPESRAPQTRAPQARAPLSSNDPTVDSARRVLRVVRNIGLGLLALAACTDMLEKGMRNWRTRFAAQEQAALERLDSRASRIASVGVALLEAGVPSNDREAR